MGMCAVDTFELVRYHGMLPQGKLNKLLLDKVDLEGTNEWSIRQFTGILYTKVIYLVYRQPGNRYDGVKRNKKQDSITSSTSRSRKECDYRPSS